MHLDRVPRITKYLSVVLLFAFLGRSSVWFFLPIYIENVIGSVFLVGLATSLPSIIPIFLDIPISSLIQRVGEKVVFLLGLAALTFPGILYMFAAPAFLIAGKTAEGFAKVLMWNGGWSLSLKSADDDVESENASIFLLGVNLAAIIGPIFGGYVIAHSGFTPLFYIWILTTIIGIGVFYHYVGVNTENPLLSSLGKLFERSTYIDDFKDFRENSDQLRKPLVLVFLYSMLLSFNWLIVPLLLNKMDANFVTMGVVFSIAGLPWLIQFKWGEIADRFGQSRVLLVLAILNVPVFLWLSTIGQVTLLGGGFILSKILLSGYSPAVHAIFDSRVDESEEGEMTGFLELVKHTGSAVGPAAAGAISSVFSLNASFIGAAVVALGIGVFAKLEF